MSTETPEISGQLPPDPRNPGWVRGWGVYRSDPWHLHGVYASSAKAAAVQLELGNGYKTAFGSHRSGTDDFVMASSDTRWIKAPLPPDQLIDKKVFARFVTKDGGQYEGIGQLRVRRRPSVDDLVAVDLVFTRRDSSTQFTDIVFFLTAAQVARLKAVADQGDHHFEYDGLLAPTVAFALEVSAQQKLNRVDELKREIEALRPFDSTTEALIERKLRMDWNYNSNAIEGNQVSRGETQLFLEHGLTAKGKPFKDYLDIRGHDAAISFLKDLVSRREQLTEAVIRELHKILLVEPYKMPAETLDGKKSTKVVRLGEYKTLPNHVRTPNGSIYHYASPEETPAMMGDLMRWYREQMDAAELHPVVIAALFHHRFTAIHPFDDGNGRMARLLTNMILMQHHLPPAVFRADKRGEYLLALHQADSGKHDEIISRLADEVIRSLDTILRGARGEPVEEPDDIDKEIALLKQQLQHLEEPEELAPAVQDRLFRETINPFLGRLGEKLSQLEAFYSTSSVTLQGHYQDGQSTRSWSAPPNTALKNLADAMETARSGKLITLIELTLTWRDLKKLPLTMIQDSLQVRIQFGKLNYTISAPVVPFTIKHVYNAPLEEKEINDFIAATCRKLMVTIQQAVPQEPAAPK
jgi:cell filamentation protein, protein adenylyltransferase